MPGRFRGTVRPWPPHSKPPALRGYNAPHMTTSEWRPASIVFFAFLSLLVLWGALRVFLPFSDSIIFGAVLAIVTYPWYRRIRRRLGGRENVAAVTMLVLITLIVLIPALLLLTLVVQQANDLFERLKAADVHKVLASMDVASRLAFLKRYFPSFDPRMANPDRLILPIVKNIPAFIAAHGAALLGGLAGIAIVFGLTLLASYFFFVQGEKLVSEIKLLSPLPDRHSNDLVSKFEEVVKATFVSQLSTSLAHGVATAIGFLIAGLPGSLLWGAMASICSLLPMVGAAIIWVPGAIYLFFSASANGTSYWPAFFLLAWGVGVISTVDNVVRPYVMRGKSEMSAVLLLFAIIGGLKVFGFVGILIGPLMLALLIAVIDIYKTSFAGAPPGEESALEEK
jgi:predicted PurR-regulated permease PerM